MNIARYKTEQISDRNYMFVTMTNYMSQTKAIMLIFHQ